jgi:hypothetical protein
MPFYQSGMGARDTNEWAKEMMLAGIDAYLIENHQDWAHDATDRLAIKKQRTRIVKFLGLAHLPISKELQKLLL